jgi:hypothetical protein
MPLGNIWKCSYYPFRLKTFPMAETFHRLKNQIGAVQVTELRSVARLSLVPLLRGFAATTTPPQVVVWSTPNKLRKSHSQST